MFKRNTYSFTVAYFWRGENMPSCVLKVKHVQSRLPYWAFVFWTIWRDLGTMEDGVREIQIRTRAPEQGYSIQDFQRNPPEWEIG